MQWIYAVPVWQFLMGSTLLACVLAAAGLFAFERVVPPRDELSHNDVAGPIVGTLGTILAVAISFLLVGNWQEYDAAAASVSQEASAVADLSIAASHLSEPERTRLRDALHAYVSSAVEREWPAMRSGRSSPQTSDAVRRVFALVAGYAPAGAAQEALQQSSIALANTLMDARRTRLFDNQLGIPGMIWAANILLAVVTIGGCYLFRVRRRSLHVAMVVGLAATIAMVMAVTAEIDYPFRGNVQISPAPLVDLQHSLFTKNLY